MVHELQAFSLPFRGFSHLVFCMAVLTSHPVWQYLPVALYGSTYQSPSMAVLTSHPVGQRLIFRSVQETNISSGISACPSVRLCRDLGFLLKICRHFGLG
jgi:hypothetical protein